MNGVLKGIYPLLLTPFHKNEEIDYESLDRLIKYYLDSGIDGISCLGDVSETDLMNEKEQRNVLDFVIDKVNRKVPIIVGTGKKSPVVTIKTVRELSELPISGILVPSPLQQTMGDSDIVKFFKEVSDASGVPIMILDNPALGYSKLSIDLIERVVGAAERVKYIKVEDQPTLPKIDQLNERLGKEVVLFGASHGRSLYWELERGISGLLTSFTIPLHTVSIYSNYVKGNKDLSKEIFLNTLPLQYFQQEKTLAVKKESLKYLKIFVESTVRSRSAGLTESLINDLRDLIDWTIGRVNEILKNRK